MKKYKFILSLLVALFTFTGCMDDGWDEPTDAGRGNTALSESNVITIAQLKKDYKSYVQTDYRDGKAYCKITEPTQIKAVVTGNDIKGNLYSEIALQDSTGAIIVAISESGICGYLPVGTEILVELQGLYVGNYGLQPEIGVPFTNTSGGTYVSRMSRILWNSHFKYTGNTKVTEPKVFNASTWVKSAANGFDDCGKLGVLKGVTIKVNNDTTTWASPSAGSGSKTLYVSGGNTDSRTEIYTSNYADFAADFVPRGKVNVTGIFKRYNSYWEVIIRSLDDVEAVK